MRGGSIFFLQEIDVASDKRSRISSKSFVFATYVCVNNEITEEGTWVA